jgi:hypothetical protein
MPIAKWQRNEGIREYSVRRAGGAIRRGGPQKGALKAGAGSQEFYGLPADPQILAERLLKESLHELGHTVGLHHCPDYRCVMGSAHAVERIDLKLAEFCAACATALPGSAHAVERIDLKLAEFCQAWASALP